MKGLHVNDVLFLKLINLYWNVIGLCIDVALIVTNHISGIYKQLTPVIGICI